MVYYNVQNKNHRVNNQVFTKPQYAYEHLQVIQPLHDEQLYVGAVECDPSKNYEIVR